MTFFKGGIFSAANIVVSATQETIGALALRPLNDIRGNSVCAGTANPGFFSDGRKMSGSFWIRRPVGSTTQPSSEGGWIINTMTGSSFGSDSFLLRIDPGWNVDVRLQGGAFNMHSNNAIPDDNSWHHVAWCADLDSVQTIRIDKTDNLVTISDTSTSANIDFSRPTGIFGTDQGVPRPFRGDIAELIVNGPTAEFIDYTQDANVDLVYNNGIAPDLGANGSAFSPTITQPQLYLSTNEGLWSALQGQGSYSEYISPYSFSNTQLANTAYFITAGPITSTSHTKVERAIKSPDFDGTLDYLYGLDTSSLANNKTLTMAFWLRPDFSQTSYLIDTLDTGIEVQMFSNTNLRIVARNNSSNIIYQADFAGSNGYTGTFTRHFALSIDLNDQSKSLYYRDGNIVTPIETVFSNDTIRHSVSNISIGARANGTSKYNGKTGIFYINNEYVTLQDNTFVTSNTAGGRTNWRHILANGIGVTGNTPPIFGVIGEQPQLNYGTLDNFVRSSTIPTNTGFELEIGS